MNRARGNIETLIQQPRFILAVIETNRQRCLLICGLEERLTQNDSVGAGQAFNIQFGEWILDDAGVKSAKVNAEGGVIAGQGQEIAGLHIVGSGEFDAVVASVGNPVSKIERVTVAGQVQVGEQKPDLFRADARWPLVVDL